MYHYPPETTAQVLSKVREALDKDEADDFKLTRIWTTLAFIHNYVLSTEIAGRIGPTVLSGPFKNMKLAKGAMEKAFGPILMGCYEHELHGVVDRIMATPYKTILNIGCSFGYYAVGFALRMPQTKIEAFDILEAEQKNCHELATLNNVGDRVKVSGIYKGEDFAAYEKEKTLALVDIEGAELQLLDPALYPALKKIDILVELHDVFVPTISKEIVERFKDTHDIEVIYNRPYIFDFSIISPPELYVDPIDSFAVAWENRGGPTPWAYMRVKSL